MSALEELALAEMEQDGYAPEPKRATASKPRKRPRSVDGIAATDSEGRPRKQADMLLDIGRRHELFHGPDGTAYARAGVAVYAIESSQYREVLAARFLDIADKGCGRNALADAITTLSSLAKHRGERRDVHLRTGTHGAGLAIDPGRDDWHMIEITADGWQWCANPPMFRRTSAMGKLPEPGAPDFSRIWRYLNVAEEHRVLVAGWMLAALRPTGPFPILFLAGEQGTGKSTAARVLRKLIDPSASLLRAPPKDVQDLLIGALNGWVLALDNLSYLGPQLSDGLCRIATGGAISGRTLYTNAEETLIEVQRPAIVNGIEDLATRPDLAERGLHVDLDVIESRLPESEFWRGFDNDAPHIFGAILAGIAASIRDHTTIQLGRLPRMADFAQWAAAGIGPLGFTADEFMTAYRDNQNIGMGAGVDSSPVGRVLLEWIRNRREWAGTAANLLSALEGFADESTRRSHAWPKSPRGLSGAIKRLAPALRIQGIEVEQDRSAQARNIRLCNLPEQPSQPSQPSFARHGNDANDANDDDDGLSPGLHVVADCPRCDGEGCQWCR